MCGILGAFSFAGEPSPSEAELRAAGALIGHRGPDAAGIHLEDSIALGHRRLSIIDLSEGANQPLHDSEKRGTIVYNGECYNYRELREELEKRGEVFGTRSDTEVVLKGLLRDGPKFLDRMIGMFALALWDRRDQSLLLVRDRLGIKPLYYLSQARRLLFASEAKAFLGFTGVQLEMDPAFLDPYLRLRYTPGPETCFKHVRKLRPGSWLRASRNGEIVESLYWDVTQVGAEPATGDLEDRFAELFAESVKYCMVADVPVGAFLSGGVDSAAVCAEMSRLSPKVKTFTFSFGGSVDESNDARAIADGLGIENQVVPLEKEDFRLLPKILWHLEEPIGDPILVPTFRLAQEAGKQLKVVLLGEGADEIQAGYVHQLALYYGEKLLGPVPHGLRAGAAQLMGALSPKWWGPFFPYPGKLGDEGVGRVRRYVNGGRSTFGERYVDLVGVFDGEQIAHLRGQAPSSATASKLDNHFRRGRRKSALNGLLRTDLNFWNTDYGMHRMDKLTMASGLEARVPYLDHRLVEFCLSVPDRALIRRTRRKALLRDAVKRRELLPKRVTSAPKRPFYLPVEKCFDKRYFDFVHETLTSRACRERGMLRPEAVSRLLGPLEKGQLGSQELIYFKKLSSLLHLELWAQIFIDGKWKECLNPAP